jgi:hypothetical protein
MTQGVRGEHGVSVGKYGGGGGGGKKKKRKKKKRKKRKKLFTNVDGWILLLAIKE